MAKRGYRGKHPHNDAKVSQHSVAGSTKRLSKLDVEYNKLSDKQKYSYIRDHQGFYPQGTMTISGTLSLGTAAITMSAADGTLLQILGAGSTAAGASPPTYKADGTAANATDGIVTCVNTNLAGKITAVNTGDTVVLTQDEPGPDGNSEIALGSSGVQCPDDVTFNGTAANNSGSLFFTGG